MKKGKTARASLLATGLALLVLIGCTGPGSGSESSDNSAAITTDPPPGMVFIPAGPFYMGMTDEQADTMVRLECTRYLENELSIFYSCLDLYDVMNNQSPQHVVYLDAFYIDQYEVTNDAYRECTATGVCFPPLNNYFFILDDHGNHPVNAVSHQQAETYCAWRGMRLPTEAEWEKAARGTDGRLFPWGNEFDASRVNLCDYWCPQEWADYNTNDGWIATAPADAYPEGASPYGVYNMIGNVWEWTADQYAEDYYANSPTENPTGPERGSEMVARGGGFYTGPGGSAAASRTHDYWTSPPRHRYTMGFRCAMDAPSDAADPDPLPTPQAAPSRPPAPADGVVEGWAVLASQEHYDGLSLMEDQEAGFGYLDALFERLVRMGWTPDHIRTLQDTVDRDQVTMATEWLAENADGDDLVFFYFSGRGGYLDLYLRWHAFFPPLWAEVPGQRMLVIDACDAEYFARAVSGDGGEGLGIGSVAGGQCNWFGQSGDGSEILGPVFTHFFTTAFDEQRADLDGDGRISVQEAAIYADLRQRTYIRETIFPVEELYTQFAALWEEDPASNPDYPSVWMGDWIEKPVFLELEP